LEMERRLSDLFQRANWIADAHRDDGKPFVVGAEEKLHQFCTGSKP
jgi:hypothetical protein